MARTKAQMINKASSKKSVVSAPSTPTSSSSATKVDRYGGGNPYCPRPTPTWQKPITDFYCKRSNSSGDENDTNVQVLNISNKIVDDGQLPHCSKDVPL